MSEQKNIDRFKVDLKALIQKGKSLQLYLQVHAFGAEEVAKVYNKADFDAKVLSALPKFSTEYEGWYSEALSVVKQLLPDRLEDFKNHFESTKVRKELNYDNYRIKDAILGYRVTLNEYKIVVDSKAAIAHFDQQLAILKAAEGRFNSSLFDIKQLVQADLFDGELESAKELLKKKFLRAAGAIAGVVLEKYLKQVCRDRGVSPSKKNSTIGDFNEALKSSSIIDVPTWRFISMLSDIRNISDHSKDVDPTDTQIQDLISGTDRIIKTIF